jgi:alpha-beta hydrolase superfamily lysophospholipase
VKAERLRLEGGAELHVQSQGGDDAPDVLYVHGSTFGCEMSLFWRPDGRSWADALAEAGLHAWGFDFVGYGRSSRYPDDGHLHGRGEEAVLQLLAVVRHIRAGNGRRPLHLLAHSWGGGVAAQAAVLRPADIASLVLFAPLLPRPGPLQRVALPPQRANTVWAQYRRFVEDVPRGHPQVLDERHFDAWARAYLASDPASATREPPSVLTPNGPAADIAELWNGRPLCDARALTQPLLLVRGEWDSVCDDADATAWLAGVGCRFKQDIVIPAGTHLLHLESGRHALHAAVNRFLMTLPAP